MKSQVRTLRRRSRRYVGTVQDKRRIGDDRDGSVLVIVVALLSLLAFTGMVFYTFAAQERSAAEYFSEAAKFEVDDPDDPFKWPLRHMIEGPGDRELNSILSAPDSRHSLTRGIVGSDTSPLNGHGVFLVKNDTNGQTYVDVNRNGEYDPGTDNPAGDAIYDLRNFVDSPAAWAATHNLQQVLDARSTARNNNLPGPDVPYTYPDINNVLLGYKGAGIRDNGPSATPRYQQITVIIPTGVRPSLLKSSLTNGAGGKDAIVDQDWWDNTAHPEYAFRMLRAHPSHRVIGYDSNNKIITDRRFLDANVPGDAALIAALPGGSGPFPFRPGESTFQNSKFGQMGFMTGHQSIDAWKAGGGSGDPPFELDSDNDGDGIREGLWIDFGYPVEETADGRLYTTMFSVTIYDLDSRLDLNIVGNLAGLNRNDTFTNAATSYFPTQFLSQSNLGLGPNEISPLWALAPRGGVNSDAKFVDWFGNDPTNQLDQANREMMWLLTGRMDYDATQPKPEDRWTVIPGRWGDSNILFYSKNGGNSRVSALPRPGRAGNITMAGNPIDFGGKQGYDDNQDTLEGVAGNGRRHGFVHPLDHAGSGSMVQGTDPRIPNLIQDDSAKPEQWIGYNKYPLVGSAGSPLNDSLYLAGRDGNIASGTDNLIANALYDMLLDDPLEVVVDLVRAIRPDDLIFSPGDMVPAHLESLDVQKAQTDLSTRLADLAPFAFKQGNVEVSSLFTTISNELRAISIPYSPQRDWEFTSDTDGNSGSNGFPQGDGRREFPPQYGSNQEFSSADPFRAVIRRLLTVELGDRTPKNGPFPLSVNHLLDVVRNSQTPAEGTSAFYNFLTKSGMRFRPLTEHPLYNEDDGTGTAFGTLTSIPDLNSLSGQLPNYPPRQPGDREFWARRDRQQMARDIYVLLYTLGGSEVTGTDIVNYTGDNSGRALYSNDRLRQMAQFAVNMVDALDTDNVVTRFEYDRNLGDGWSLDDDPWTDDGMGASSSAADTGNGLYPEDSASDRGVVFGVEGQQLAFSEVLGTRFQDFAKYNGTSNDPTTYFDDKSANSLANEASDRRDRYSLMVELQNVLPMGVELSPQDGGSGFTPDGEEAIWQLARFDRNGSANDKQSLTPDQQMSFLAGINKLGGGDRFTISMATTANAGTGTPERTNPLGFGTADIYLSNDGGNKYTLVAPDPTNPPAPLNGGATPDPLCDIDTVHANDKSKFTFDMSQTTNNDPGRFLDSIPYVAGNQISYKGNDDFDLNAVTAENDQNWQTGQGFDLVLRRRLNPNLPKLSLAENPWIEVDRIRVEFRDLFEFTNDGMGNFTAAADFDNLLSSERDEPLDSMDLTANLADKDPAAPGNLRYNSFGQLNDRNYNFGGSSVKPFQLWQAHFDRDFASPAELLSLPIIGPNLLTHRLDRMRFGPAQQVLDNPRAGSGGTPEAKYICSAETMFLQPKFPTGITGYDNAWYRLLRFVEVPSRVNRMLGNYLDLDRVPGKLNVNTIPDVTIYGGLIDDPVMGAVTYSKSAPFMTDITPGGQSMDLQEIAAPGNGNGKGPPFTPPGWANNQTKTVSFRDRWFELLMERDGATNAFDADNNQQTVYWVPGMTSARPFRPNSYVLPQVTADGDNGLEYTLLRHGSADIANNDESEKRHWLEVGGRGFHKNPDSASLSANAVTRHQLLSKVMNNTTTTSNAFIVYITAAYFESIETPQGLVRVGGRMGLDTDGDGDPTNDAGWEKRAVFIIDRSELFHAYDSASGGFDWERLVKYRADLPSDGK
ncbi:MAG: hypothetical protein KDA96_08905 [Planctomycetaceae bacterium]|nr:hypothetical protein [Planctomycetaceae bacterium]